MSARPIVLVGDRLPPRLGDLVRPPKALFVRGELPRGPAVAVVGTRKPTPEGLRFAEQLARELATAGVCVLSGGAEGIDTAAHHGALLARGSTCVVAPAGYAVPFPAENAALFRRVIDAGGAYVSLVPDDVVATRAAFFPRNACLAALAHAVVVVQAGVRSGARNAAACARRLGRLLFAVPSSPWVERGVGRGCVLELRLGASICESAKDVLRALERAGATLVPLPGRAVAARRPARSPPSPDRPAVDGDLRALLQKGHRHPDELSVLLGWPASRVQARLLTLELEGVLVPGPPRARSER